MFKVKDAADQLGVTRVEIFEILLSQRELFDPYVVKKNSITYISDEGMALLGTVIRSNGSSVEMPATPELVAIETNGLVNLGETAVNPVMALEDNPDIGENPIDQEKDNTEVFTISGENLACSEEEDFMIEAEAYDEIITGGAHGLDEEHLDTDYTQITDVALKKITDEFHANIQENSSVSRIESDDLLVGQWLKEIQTEDEQAIQLDLRLREIRGQVTGLRNKILVLDSEIKRKDEAIKHYHEIMKDDLRWLEDMERKVQLIVKSQLAKYEAEESVESITESIAEDDKGNFFKFFKR